VEFAYQDNAFRAGSAISITSLLAWAALWWRRKGAEH
jgi:hypothetical protein